MGSPGVWTGAWEWARPQEELPLQGTAAMLSFHFSTFFRHFLSWSTWCTIIHLMLQSKQYDQIQWVLFGFRKKQFDICKLFGAWLFFHHARFHLKLKLSLFAMTSYWVPSTNEFMMSKMWYWVIFKWNTLYNIVN